MNENRPVFTVSDVNSYIKALLNNDESLKELADLLEVIYAVVAARGYSVEELERIRLEKAKERGTFEKRLLLKSVSE